MKDWGEPYGPGPHFLSETGEPITMRRRGQRVRFFTDNGEQVGPEQRNVFPALCWVYAETEWFDPRDVMGTVRCREEVRSKVRYR